MTRCIWNKRKKKTHKYGAHDCSLEECSYSFLPKLEHTNLLTKFWNSIIRFLQKNLIVSSSAAYLGCQFRSHSSINFERRRQINLGYLYIIHPYSNFRFLWEFIMLVNYSIALGVIPLEIAMNFIAVLKEDYLGNFEGIMYVMHIIFLIDIVINFRTGYRKPETKEVELAPKKIALQYLKTYFIFDAISSVPPLFHTVLVYKYQWELQRTLWVMLSYFKIVRIKTFSDMMERLAERLHIPELIFRACRFLLRSFLTFHWGALTLIAVPFMQDKVNESSNHVWFFYEDENFMNENFDNIYLICFYRAVGVSLANVNMEFMASMGDFMVTVAFHMLGTVYIAYVYVEVLDLMTSKFEPETKYDEFMTQLQEYMKNKQLPINIQDRLISFYEYRFRNAFFKEATFKATLSDRLQKEISMYGCEQMMKSVDLFQYLSKNDIEDLVKALQVQVYLPKDLIIKAGSIGNMMYFLSCGTVAVYTPSGKEVCHLYDGSYFGEIALIMKDKKRTATVIAVEICEVYILDRYTFNRRLVSNEIIYNIIFNLCQQRIKETKAVEVLLKKSSEHAEDETAIELIEEYD